MSYFIVKMETENPFRKCDYVDKEVWSKLNFVISFNKNVDFSSISNNFWPKYVDPNSLQHTFGELFLNLLGTIHKWRRLNFGGFWPSPSTCRLSKALKIAPNSHLYYPPPTP